MRLTGELNYIDGDDDHIQVNALIIRDDQTISFDVITTWNDPTNKWQRTGIAKLINGKYVTEAAPSYHVESKAEGVPCRLAFEIGLEKDGFYEVKGIWEESGTLYEFDGELEVEVK